MLYLLAYILLLFLPTVAIATDYYAEAGGLDTNTCTLASKCKTAAKLIERTLSPGDNLHLKCGETYREIVELDTLSAGTTSQRITLKSYGTCYSQQGTHTGANNASNLVATGTNFTAVGVLPGHRLFNLTKGAHCNVSSITTTNTANDTLICDRGLSSNIPETWDTHDRYSIDNKPIITQASLFNSGWTEAATNVWFHTFTKHPGRSMWINGRSGHDDMHDGTCSTAGMASATDGQMCSICDSGTGDSCGPGKVYIKSTSNPASRWTTPGVEVVHLFENSNVAFEINHQAWTIRDIAFEKVIGLHIHLDVSNITITNVRLGDSQRKACPPMSNCVDRWQGKDYPWLIGQDDRGSELIKVSATSGVVLNNIVMSNLIGYGAENNGIALSGTGNITASISNSELWHNSHSMINFGLSSSSAGIRNLTLDRMIIHQSATAFHSGTTGATMTYTLSNSLIYDGAADGDLRFWGSFGRDDPFNVFHEDAGTFTYNNNLFVQNEGHALRLRAGTHNFNNNIFHNNTTTGINANNSAKVRLNNNIFADNCNTTIGNNCFQVGCSTATCNVDSLYQNPGNNNNKYRQPSGTAFGYFSGGDTSVTLAEWQAITDGDAQSVVTNDCFVDTSLFDYNLASGCDDIAANRGPFRQLTLLTATMTGSVITTTWSIGGTSPLSMCDKAEATVSYDATPQLPVSCVASGSTVTLTMPAPPSSEQTVHLSGNYGFTEDSTKIGGYLNARSRPFGPIAFVPTGSESGSGAADCTLYASPNGSGTTCSLDIPCTVSQAVADIACGETICLLNGVYEGVTQIINLDNKVCTAPSPLVIRALNWGKARLDGQSVRTPVTIGTNAAYITLNGFDASNAQTEVFSIKGRNITVSDAIGFNAGLLGNSMIFESNGTMAVTTETNQPGTAATTARTNVFDTVAGFGRAVKAIQAYQTEGMRISNSFGQWMCTQDTQQKSVLDVTESRSITVEDNIISWNEITANCTPANSSQKGKYLGNHRDNRWGDGTQETCLNNNFYGNIALLKQTDVGPGSYIFRSDAERCSRHEHNLSYIEPGVNHTAMETFSLGAASDGASGTSLSIACSAGTGGTDCNYHALNNTSIHNGNTPSYDADWLQSNNLTDATPRDISTNPWTALIGANLCLKFVNGVRTSVPRWPWELNQRLIAAMQTAGYTPVDVHADIQAALGIIPQRCLRGSHEQAW